MRFFLVSLLFCTALLFQAHGQSPQGINYQGVARDSDGKPLVSQDISIRISILKDDASGEIEFAETHTVKTNSFGLFTLVIGQGKTSTGSFGFISWAIGTKWLQIELDPAGGKAFQVLGSQQLMSVPYAFYSTFSGNGLTAGNGIKIQNNQIVNTGDGDNSTTNELITGITLGTDKKLKISEAGITKEVDLSSLSAGSQGLGGVLAVGNDATGLKITNLGAPSAPADAATKQYVDGHSDADNSVTNEIQDLTKTGNTLTLSGDATTVDLAPYLDNTDNQDLSLTGNTLSLANDVSPVNLAPYLDNTDSQTLTTQSVDANTRSISIAGGNTLNLDVRDADASITNELQNLGNTASGTLRTITISGGTSTTIDVADNDNDATNELQNLNQVLTQGKNAGGLQIQNLGAPTAGTDATTKGYVDNAIATTYAFKTAFAYSNTSGSTVNDQQLPFTTEEFDDFNILSGSSFTASVNGTYVFTIDGSYFATSAGQLSLLYNSIKYSIAIVQPFGSTSLRYNATFMFKLTAGQTVRLVGDNIPINGQFAGSFFGYKL